MNVAVEVVQSSVLVDVAPDQTVAVTVVPAQTIEVEVAPSGAQGPPGQGVPVGGAVGQVLAKASATDHDTLWVDQTGGGGAVDSVNAQTGVVVLDAADVGADAAGVAAAAVTAHTADTTAVHGIADTAALVLTGDARLSDARTPTAHAASHKTGGTDVIRLDELAAPTAPVALNAQPVQGLADPTLPQDAATRAWVLAQIAALVAAAPGLLDTLDELAAALGDDPNFAATVTAALAGKQPLDTDLSAIAALVSAADKIPMATGAGTWTLADLTAAGRALIDDPDVPAQRATLGLGSLATVTPTGTPDGTKMLRDDLSWATVGSGLPAGGATSNALVKLSAVDGDAGWTAAPTFDSTSWAGITGALNPSRYVGRFSSGSAPVSGTWTTGDWGTSPTGLLLCTAGGTPGAWVVVARAAVINASFLGSVSNSTVETSMGLGGPSSGAGQVGGLIAAGGIVTNNTGSSQTLRLRVKIGATFILDTGLVSLTTSATQRPWHVEVAVNKRSASLLEVTGVVMIGGTVATGTMVAPTSTLEGYGTASEDWNAAPNVFVYATLGAASASFSAVGKHMEVWSF